jgi:methyl-accepting chemotaxis protein
VADEVRKLAERTRELTGEIQKTIGSIRKETATATTCMEAGRVMAENGVQTAQQASTMIVEIRESLDAINLAVGNIADELSTQEAVADATSNQIANIARLSEENAENAESSRDLANQSENSSRALAQAASLFRV